MMMRGARHMVPLLLLQAGAALGDVTAASMLCKQDPHYMNSYDGKLNRVESTYFLSGMRSVHDSHHEDRRFRLTFCRPADTTNPVAGAANLPVTSYDAEWTRSCGSMNDGNAAMLGGSSVHDSHREDREWTWRCGALTADYVLGSCHWTGYTNGYDGAQNYKCRDNGVIRAVHSIHNSHHEDRKYEFECCKVNKKTWSHKDATASWSHIRTCIGCVDLTYELLVGVQSSLTQSTTTEQQRSITSSIGSSLSFTYMGATSSITASLSTSQSNTVSKSLSETFSHQKVEKTTIACAKNYIYQFQIMVDETFGHASSSATVLSHHYLCTNERDPKCPPLMCADDDCQTCRE